MVVHALADSIVLLYYTISIPIKMTKSVVEQNSFWSTSHVDTFDIASFNQWKCFICKLNTSNWCSKLLKISMQHCRLTAEIKKKQKQTTTYESSNIRQFLVGGEVCLGVFDEQQLL